MKTRAVQSIDILTYGGFNYYPWDHPYEGEKQFSRAMIDYYAQFLKYGSIAIDIGAHTGDTTLPIALAGYKETIAFEPNPHVFEILKLNAMMNPHLHIEPVCAAIIEPPGQYTFYYGSEFCNGGHESVPGEYAAPSGDPVAVRGVSLIPTLRLIADKVGFIKIDTEGHDRHVLESLIPVKDQLRAAIQIEIYPNLTQDGIKKLEKTIDDLGYRMYTVDLKPISRIMEVWMAYVACDIVLLRK